MVVFASCADVSGVRAISSGAALEFRLINLAGLRIFTGRKSILHSPDRFT
jgi:hypothetical protein